MKTDTYVSLCLEQGAKSSLHYKHGCIIVNGGKVIGQGYNDYKPGFNGGALKHGRIAKGAYDGHAIAGLKEKLKKQKDKPKQQAKQPQHIFTPFEGTGGGHIANIPLSIHSEMMAVHSALAASSTLSSTAFSCEKPCFKLPRSDKRKARLRREVLESFKSAVLNLPHINQMLHHHGHNNNVQQQEDVDEDVEEQEQQVSCRSKEKGRAFHEKDCGEKHHHQKKKEKVKTYQYHSPWYGQQTQQLSTYKNRVPSPNVERQNEFTTISDTDGNAVASHASNQHYKYKKDYKRSGKMKSKPLNEPAQPDPLLIRKCHTGERSSSLKDRKKHPRLNGADLYVARLGSCGINPNKPSKRDATAEHTPEQPNNENITSSTSSLPLLTPTSSTSSGSLHDELINPRPSPGTTPPTPTKKTIDLRSVRSSRPCYRCISYMHSVGIKRVFWTNDSGEWEGAKVRDLVDALENSMDSVAGGGPMGNGVFVTKHEVLMLRRMMGGC